MTLLQQVFDKQGYVITCDSKNVSNLQIVQAVQANWQGRSINYVGLKSISEAVESKTLTSQFW